MKISILVVCTGKYIKFFEPLYKSIMEKFLPKYEKTIFFFTDNDCSVPDNVVKTIIKRRGFPGDTLYRYHYFLLQRQRIEQTDVTYYMDVDSFVKDYVGDEILPTESTPLVGCLHPGFYKTTRPFGTPEMRARSTAFLNDRSHLYICGGFNGGLSKSFMNLSEQIAHNIDVDMKNNIIARFHDESHINAYYSKNKTLFKLLTPSYMFPESWTTRQNLKGLVPRILALDKNHAEIRK